MYYVYSYVRTRLLPSCRGVKGFGNEAENVPSGRTTPPQAAVPEECVSNSNIQPGKKAEILDHRARYVRTYMTQAVLLEILFYLNFQIFHILFV